MFSNPMDRRIVSGRILAAASSSTLSWEWVVEAGWMIKDFASPTFASKEKSLVAPQKVLLASDPPFNPKEKTELVPLGKYSCARSK